jgi:hypothetical protein
MKLLHPKDKGSRFERTVSEILRGYGFKDARRTPLSGAIKGIDNLSGDITSKSWPFFTEVKCTEKPNFLKYYKKAESESGAKPPIIIWTKNREQIYCFLLLSDLINIMLKGFIMKEKYKKPEKPKRLSLEETSGLKWSKAKMLGKKLKNNKK